jgi:hypothetical protein
VPRKSANALRGEQPEAVSSGSSPRRRSRATPDDGGIVEGDGLIDHGGRGIGLKRATVEVGRLIAGATLPKLEPPRVAEPEGPQPDETVG